MFVVCHPERGNGAGAAEAGMNHVTQWSARRPRRASGGVELPPFSWGAGALTGEAAATSRRCSVGEANRR